LSGRRVKPPPGAPPYALAVDVAEVELGVGPLGGDQLRLVAIGFQQHVDGAPDVAVAQITSASDRSGRAIW